MTGSQFLQNNLRPDSGHVLGTIYKSERRTHKRLETIRDKDEATAFVWRILQKLPNKRDIRHTVYTHTYRTSQTGRYNVKGNVTNKHKNRRKIR